MDKFETIPNLPVGVETSYERAVADALAEAADADSFDPPPALVL